MIVAADVFHVIAEANVGLIFNSALAGVGSWSLGAGAGNRQCSGAKIQSAGTRTRSGCNFRIYPGSE